MAEIANGRFRSSVFCFCFLCRERDLSLQEGCTEISGNVSCVWALFWQTVFPKMRGAAPPTKENGGHLSSGTSEDVPCPDTLPVPGLPVNAGPFFRPGEFHGHNHVVKKSEEFGR